jgi:hypothetical protein
MPLPNSPFNASKKSTNNLLGLSLALVDVGADYERQTEQHDGNNQLLQLIPPEML